MYFLLLTGLCGAQELERGMRALLASSPGAMRAQWGIQVVALKSGAVLFRHQANRYFTPASNAKLFSTALALVRLGPDYRFETRVLADAAPDSAGVVKGDVRLVGGGDPSLSGRAYPYRKDGAGGNPLQAIEEFADQVYSRGVRRIQGDIVGDDRAYLWAPAPEGWACDDALWEYGAPVSALAVNDNTVTVSLLPGPDGARLSVSPTLEYFAIDNRVRVVRGQEEDVQADRSPGSRQFRIWGTLAATRHVEMQLLLAVDDPALYAACALADALVRRGIAIEGVPRAEHRLESQVEDLKKGEPLPPPRGVELARRNSPPLIELLRVIDKVSQNLHAEIMLREVGRVRRGLGSRQAGLEEMKIFLAEAGVAPTDVNLVDGSGLSRLDLVTPEAVVQLLKHMYASRNGEAWRSLLPVGGEDGTLAMRFAGQPRGRLVRAKTGSLEHVNSLSGYIDAAAGPVAFSILADNSQAPSSEIRAVIDKMGLLISRAR